MNIYFYVDFNDTLTYLPMFYLQVHFCQKCFDKSLRVGFKERTQVFSEWVVVEKQEDDADEWLRPKKSTYTYRPSLTESDWVR